MCNGMNMNDPNRAGDNHQGNGLSQHCLLIQSGAYLNREGATLLVTGDLDAAIPRFLEALEMLALAGGLLPSVDITTAYFSRSFPFQNETPRRLSSCQNPVPVPPVACDDGSYFVYSNPFVFHPIAVDTPEYATNCAAVCLFNLGLALHQRGRQADSRSLYRAETMYDMSLQLVASMTNQAACANLKVAGTNNKAHVQFEVSEVHQAKNTLHSLLSILGTKDTPPPFEEGEIERFYMNVLAVNGSTLAGAA